MSIDFCLFLLLISRVGGMERDRDRERERERDREGGGEGGQIDSGAFLGVCEGVTPPPPSLLKIHVRKCATSVRKMRRNEGGETLKEKGAEERDRTVKLRGKRKEKEKRKEKGKERMQ